MSMAYTVIQQRKVGIFSSYLSGNLIFQRQLFFVCVFHVDRDKQNKRNNENEKNLDDLKSDKNGTRTLACGQQRLQKSWGPYQRSHGHQIGTGTSINSKSLKSMLSKLPNGIFFGGNFNKAYNKDAY